MKTENLWPQWQVERWFVRPTLRINACDSFWRVVDNKTDVLGIDPAATINQSQMAAASLSKTAEMTCNIRWHFLAFLILSASSSLLTSNLEAPKTKLWYIISAYRAKQRKGEREGQSQSSGAGTMLSWSRLVRFFQSCQTVSTLHAIYLGRLFW